MKKWIKLELTVVLIAAIIGALASCKEKTETSHDLALNTETSKLHTLPEKPVNEEFKKYWYAGEAELSSYELKQARYGEIRDGKAVLVFVTEPFSSTKQVKADANHDTNIPMLKLNSTKKFLTGIYPYSVMTSSFYPVHDNQHALKVTFSMQEWCGQVYGQLNNREKFEIESFSYFESEGDQKLQLEKTTLENEIWNKIRINPTELPIGTIQILPAFEYLRMAHKELKPYTANASISENDGISTYKISYPELDRTLIINFTSVFPYSIESWSESFIDGYGSKAKMMTSTAKKVNTLKSPYWTKGSNKYLHLRDSLGL